MKKILVVFDGAHFPSATLNFALELHSRSPIMLTGIFLPSVDYSGKISYFHYGNTIAPLYPEEHESDLITIKKNIGLFEDFCKEHQIDYAVHQNVQDKVTRGLQRESRYADLLILSSMHFYENLGEMIQENYLTDTLHQSECPVVLLPGSYTRPENVILAYDGSSTSMYAIKQFSYLLPQFSNLNVMVLYAEDDKKETPSLSLLQEYANQHFSNIVYHKLHADPQKNLVPWLAHKEPAIVVSGSYGRSAFSELFRKNFLKNVIHEQEVSLFIAHL